MKKFTLIELLVVVAIIGILVTLLMPSLIGAREKAKYAVCVSNKNQQYKLITLGIADNNTKYPLWWTGNTKNTVGDYAANMKKEPQYNREDWMGALQRVSWSMWATGPVYGIINPVAGHYSGHTNWTYKKGQVDAMGIHPLVQTMRCPSLEQGELGSGVGSNGAFDYTFPQALRGASSVKFSTTVEWYGEEMPTPLVVEEDPENLNGGYRETAWGNDDKIGTWHDFGKKGSYTATDGSNVAIRAGAPYTGENAYIYEAETKTTMRSCSTTSAVNTISYKDPASTYSQNIYRW